MSERIVRMAGLVTLFVIAAVSHAAFAAGASGAGAIMVRIDSVLAADTNQGCDQRLHAMRNRLRHAFGYTTFRLVTHEERQTALGDTAVFTLPGGRLLHVQPLTLNRDMIDMEVMLFQGERPTMTTDFKIKNHGLILVGGPRYEQGELIISIAADAPLMPGKASPTATPDR